MANIQKKGALELSMTTIIVIVIGVTLLTLGLAFVRTIFGSASDIASKVGEISSDEISKMVGESSDPITITSASVTIKQGESNDIRILYRNVGSSAATFNVKLDMTTVPQGAYASDVENWFLYSPAFKIPVGGGYVDRLSIDVPDNAIPGRYGGIFTVECGGSDACARGMSTPFILRVTA